MLAERPEHSLLPVSTAARRLGVTPGTIRRAVRRGELSARRLGARGPLRIEPEELERFARRVKVG